MPYSADELVRSDTAYTKAIKVSREYDRRSPFGNHRLAHSQKFIHRNRITKRLKIEEQQARTDRRAVAILAEACLDSTRNVHGSHLSCHTSKSLRRLLSEQYGRVSTHLTASGYDSPLGATSR
jgi:hypothetical protein